MAGRLDEAPRPPGRGGGGPCVMTEFFWVLFLVPFFDFFISSWEKVGKRCFFCSSSRVLDLQPLPSMKKSQGVPPEAIYYTCGAVVARLQEEGDISAYAR